VSVVYSAFSLPDLASNIDPYGGMAVLGIALSYIRPAKSRGIDTDTTRFTSGTRYVIPRSHNQFCQGSLPYITAATALLTTTATTFLSPATIRTDLFQLIFLHPIDLPSSNHGATD
jgi:hypothetical protein